jgi:hypothetical protein
VTEISIGELLAAMPDAKAVDEHWRRICRQMVAETAAAEYERGRADGAIAAIAALKRAQHQAVDDLDAYLNRWHVCCPRCRQEGHKEGCPDCQASTQETFGDPLAGDYPGGAAGIARTKDTWEKAGFDFPHWGPDWVHLSGPTVHWHKPCTAACYAYEPGWYRIAAAIAIIETLPGDYAEALADLRRQIATAPGRTAA